MDNNGLSVKGSTRQKKGKNKPASKTDKSGGGILSMISGRRKKKASSQHGRTNNSVRVKHNNHKTSVGHQGAKKEKQPSTNRSPSNHHHISLQQSLQQQSLQPSQVEETTAKPPEKHSRGTKASAANKNLKSVRLFPTIPKNYAIFHRDIDEEECFKLVEKLKNRKEQGLVPEGPQDAKSLLILDRIKKKKITPITSKVGLKKNKEQKSDEKSQVAEKSKSPERKDSETKDEKRTDDEADDDYENVPKFKDVEKMKEPSVFDETGNPTWMAVIEPTDEDMKDVEPSIAVGSEHIAMFHEKKFFLQTAPSDVIVIDQWQPARKLQQRDDKIFTAELLFSNTIRSLINVAVKYDEKKKYKPASPAAGHGGEELITQEENMPPVTFAPIKSEKLYVTYLRNDPIRTARLHLTITKSEIDANKWPNWEESSK